jgi:hypothetical protein
MKTNPVLVDASVERRLKPRIRKAFRVNVRGANAKGEPFEAATVLDNLSSSGLYLRVGQDVEKGSKLSILIRLSNSPDDDARVANVAVEGTVLRAEPLPDEAWGLAIRISSRRFM